MISVVVLSRNATTHLHNCLVSLRESAAALGWRDDSVEWIFIDDCSDSEHNITQLYAEFRSLVPSGARINILRFREHKHYAFGLATALSTARGSVVLFFSHDMIIPPACVRTMLEVASSDPTIGVVRPTSRHMDWSETLQVAPPMPARRMEDISSFAELLRLRWGLAIFEHMTLIGDAMLITRAAIERVGVFDTSFFGLLADVDYGLRVARSGLRIVSPRGAWLHHEGAGFRLSDAASRGQHAYQETGTQIKAQLDAAYAVFRQKWGMDLPEQFKELRWHHFKQLRTMDTAPCALYQPPIGIDPTLCDVL